MAVLIVHGPAGRSEFPLVGPVTVIGRGDTADLRVLDSGVSREHCRIERVGDSYRLADTGSRNGTVVNGSATRAHPLSPGDEITLGKYRIVFDPPREPDAAPPAHAGVGLASELALAPAEAGPASSDLLALSQASVDRGRERYVLEILTGQHKGSTFDLAHDLIIGTDPSCGIRLVMGGVEPRHAKLTHDRGTWFIEDIAGGMMVGGRKALKAHLTAGMTVALGNAQLLFKNVGMVQELDIAPRTLMLADTRVLSFADLERKTSRKRWLIYAAIAFALATLSAGAVLLLR